MFKHAQKWASVLIGVALLFAGCSGGQSERGSSAARNSESSQRQEEQEGSSPRSEDNTPISVEQLQSQVESVYADTSESVVNITSQVMSPGIFNQPMPQEGAGSGFVYDESGHVVTNYHVVQNAQSISVSLSNGDVYEASVVGSDPFTDLAVLQIDGEGVLVVSVLDGSPAEDAGIQGGDRQLRLGNLQLPVGGDVIVGVGDEEVGSYKELVVYLESETEIGDTITVRYYRGEDERTAELTVGRRPEDVQANLTQ